MLLPEPACKFLAEIDAAKCIGCNFCRQACPFDAITGAPGYRYLIIDQYCTGCRDCIAPCPVDCIAIVTNPAFKDCTHTQRKEFAMSAKLRARKLIERLQQRDAVQRAEFSDLKLQAQQRASSTIASLKLKLGPGNTANKSNVKPD